MNWIETFKHELKALLSNPVVLLTVIGGPLLYSVLYPLPYLNQTPTEQQVSVVNLDPGKLSYELERWVDATPQVQIERRAFTIEEAKEQFLKGEVEGILVIPENFTRDLLLGKSPTLSFAGDASYFLVYGTIVEGLGQAAGTLASTAKVARMIIDGVPMALATQSFSAVDLNLKPTFNPTQGYVSYVVPAIFIFILHQMLIVGIGIHTASEEKRLTLPAVCVRTLIFVALFLLLAAYYFGWSLDFYNVAIHGALGDILLIILPMLIGASIIGILLGELVPHREMVTAVVLMGSMPLIFGAGFVWPIESMPDSINLLMSFSPSTPAIQALLKVNQMGASFNQVQSHYLLLLAQVVLWSLALVYLLIVRNRKLAFNFR